MQSRGTNHVAGLTDTNNNDDITSENNDNINDKIHYRRITTSGM